MHEDPLYLEPRLERPLAALLGERAFLHTLVGALGSPLAVLIPGQLGENVGRFRAVYGRHRLTGRVLLAHKANGAHCLVRHLAATDAALDAASLRELQHALGSGFAPDRLLCTGPKDPEFLWLAARTGTTVHLDSRGELEQLTALVREYGLPRVPVLLRLSGFESPGVRVRSRPSRFGTYPKELDALLDSLERHRDTVEPIGTAYHLDTTSLDEKAVALEGCLLALDALRQRGFQPRAVDIGGGFGVNYLAHGAQWERYTSALAEAVLGRGQPLTRGGHGYGLRTENGVLRGTLGLYPCHRPVAGPAYLDELLARPAPLLGRPLGTLLLDSLCELWTEPGRALLDQCGLTLARVLDVRTPDTGPPLVRLAAKASDIGLEEHGVLMDPVLVPQGDGPAAGAPAGVHLVGSLCLESDLITRRTVFLPRLPRPGDLLAFANTAGYCMDFHATRAQGQPPARKVAVRRSGAGGWSWCLDEKYWPVTRPEVQRT
ncbi:Y4yA family PLP-dependent enzyme [Streptomyces gamaensis]|uniref:Y4yA family PLP-dependent enzyme n=1 Tax=Streptomyces gamaensis TaxID=1763542 RepID=A0ABW0ZA42_9ACTN